MQPGEILDNRYEIVKQLGAGGMGEVYLATHTHLGSPRVIKVVHPHISGNTDARDRFLREARAATKVHHPNVATLHDFSTLTSGSHYMVWEYIDGENLAQKLRARGTLPPREAVRLVIQALHGLEAIHRAGIIHRDISPENLMITRDDESVKIIDLGVAKVEDSEVSQTRTGIFVGKLRYAAPEQLGFMPEDEKIDARADVYATAMVLVELLTGRPPYEAKSPHEYFILHASQAPIKPVELPAELPGSTALQAVLAKALARNRNDRYTTAREFALALEEIERTLPDPREMATMAMPYDGDETMKLGRKTVDTLHRSTVVTGAQQAPAPPTLATPLPAAIPAPPQPAAPPQPQAPPTVLTPFPQQQFAQQAPKQGSMLPLLVVVAVILMFAGVAAFALYKYWPFGKQPETVSETTTTVATTTTQAPPKVAESTLTVTSPATETVVTTTTAAPPPPVIAENTQTTATTPELSAPVKPVVKPPVVKPPVVVAEKPPVKDPDEEEAAPSSEEDSEPSGGFGAPTYVDGGDDDYRNERALTALRRALRGTNVVALRAGGMTPELARALREEFPDLRFEAQADVVIRFEGTFERRPRALKRRAATATVSKNGRVIFRYQLPDEVYRVGMSPAESFARVLANAMNE
ncbi:MAG TPA: serine/threonine-protein kinase [Thermoanaerobaculia bacterium]|nr:serine/threonine-protein kinase [Thermoanaerobaculia bacterium]